MTEFGVIAVKGAQNRSIEGTTRSTPEAARMPVSLLFEQLAETDMRIERLTEEIEETYKQARSQRLATIRGVGIFSATIIAAPMPDVDNFDCAGPMARPHT